MPRVNGKELDRLITKCNVVYVPTGFNDGYVHYIQAPKTNVQAALRSYLDKEDERSFTVTYTRSESGRKILMLGTASVVQDDKLCIYCSEEVDEYHEYHFGYHGACARKHKRKEH